MTHRFFAFLACLLALTNIKVCSQGITTPYPLETLRGWDNTECAGDLNKDGIADLAIVSIPRIAANMHTNEAGYEYNFNRPILAIFWGDADGHYTCWRQYDNVIAAQENEFHSINTSLDITPQGVLRISIEHFHSAGSWTNLTETFVYRYQQGDFFLIGEDEESMARNTGEAEYISTNYLTRKRQHRTFNTFDERVKPKERWTRLAKQPLERMGARTLGN